jgi:hypothetical protein
MANSDGLKSPDGIVRAVQSIFRAEPFLWAVKQLIGCASAMVKDLAVRRMLHAPGLHLGPGCKVGGAKHISFGRNIYATRNLWLEAVTRYRCQDFHPAIEIGDDTSFSDGVHISSIERIVIKKNVLMGSRIYISDHNHGAYKGSAQSPPEEPPARRLLGEVGQSLSERTSGSETMWS